MYKDYKIRSIERKLASLNAQIEYLKILESKVQNTKYACDILEKFGRRAYLTTKLEQLTSKESNSA